MQTQDTTLRNPAKAIFPLGKIKKMAIIMVLV